jgi:hypothetical protein
MGFDWHNVATIAGTMSLIGGVMIALMRRFFVSTEKCAMTQKGCQGEICRKVDELKAEIKEDRKIASDHYAEIKEALGIITGKLESM